MIILRIGGLLYTDNTIYIDSIRCIIVYLTLWIALIIYLSIVVTTISKVYNLIIVTSMLVFTLKSNIIFFLTFESVALIIIGTVIIKGLYEDRFKARLYFILYTSLTIVPIFILFMKAWVNGLTTHYIINSTCQNIIGVSSVLVLGFLVKIPIYPFHLWLIKTHLEAPVEGSIILAGLLLKLGTYGLIRFRSLWINTSVITIILPFTFTGALIISLNCLYSQDYKLLVANSSIVHINICLFSCVKITEHAITTRLMTIIRHGLTSSGLFNIRNIIYKNTNRRRFLINKGLLASIPYISIWLFILLITNIAVPPRINMMSEIRTLTIITSISYTFIIPVALFCFVAGLYSIYYFYMVINGNTLNYNINLENKININLIQFMHIIPLFTFIFWSSIIY